jgi:hypothetical protein
VLAVAVERFERDGAPALRARTLAAAAGTSTAALHEMLGVKADLARAVFFAGFDELDAGLAGVPETGDPRADAVALLAATRRFALDHPRLFDLMFGRPITEYAPTPADWFAARRIHDRAITVTRRYLGSVGSQNSPEDVALALVALNRGLIATELSGQLGRAEADRDRRWRAAIDAQLDGYARIP